MAIPNRPLYGGSLSSDESYVPDSTAPDLVISVVRGGPKAAFVVLQFKWTQDVGNFRFVPDSSSSVSVDVGTLSDFSGEGDIYTVKWTFPENAVGVGDVTILANEVTNADGTTGPPETRSFTINYDTRTATAPSPANVCVQDFAFSDASNPFIEVSGGSFEGWLEPPLVATHGGEDYLYSVLEISPYTIDYDKIPTPSDATGPVIVSAQGINHDVQASAALVKLRISDCSWTVLKRYRYVSTAARSLHLRGNQVYWFEGSHYAYYNEGLVREVEDPEGEFYVRLGGAVEEFTRKAAATLDGEFSVNTAETEMTIVTSGLSASYADAKAALQNDALLFIGTSVIKISNIRITGVNIVGVRVVFDYDLVDGDLPAVDETSFIDIGVANVIDAYTKYRLRSTYRDFTSPLPLFKKNWKAEIGHLYRVDAADTIEDLGLNWVSSSLSEDPHTDKTRPYYEEKSIDRHYGWHGGTATPIIDDGNLSMITGYSGFEDLLENESESARLGNWQWIEWTDALDLRVPLLETNGKTVWDVVKDLAVIGHLYVAFDGETFSAKSKLPIRGALEQDVSATDTTIPLQALTRDAFPNSGILRIEDEIIAYSSLTGGNPSGVMRGAEGTTAAAHTNGTLAHFVDHIIEWDRYAVDPMDRIAVRQDESNIYNHVSFDYGAEVPYEVSDAQSLSRYPFKSLDRRLPLDKTQRNLAKHLAEQYLAALKSPRQTVTFNLKLSLYLKRMEVIYVRETDRTGLSHLLQLVKVDHQLFKNLTVVTAVVV